MKIRPGRLIAPLVAALAGAAAAFAQRPKVEVETLREGESLPPIWHIFLVLSVAAIIAFVAEMRRRRRAKTERAEATERHRRKLSSAGGAIDADREIDWARKRAARSVERRARQARKGTRTDRPAPEPAPAFGPASPVFAIDRIELARPFHPLQASNDEFLLDAIDQLSEDYLEDLEARDLALNVLKKFRTSNAIEALADVALYDISGTLRAKAVTILADFDHESVFETLVIASADPSREVKAAAARAIFRLTIDRREAWLRLAEMPDRGRRRQCARAVADGDFPQRAIDRLTRPEREQVLESVALIALLAAEGELEPITNAFERHSNDDIGLALVHVIGILENHHLFEYLESRKQRKDLGRAVFEKIDAVLERGLSPATRR